MSEHNFEQQVKQKMDDLSLDPSAPVWDRVAAEIRPEKDRRRILLWICPILLAIGIAGMLWHQNETRPAATSAIQVKTSEAQKRSSLVSPVMKENNHAQHDNRGPEREELQINPKTGAATGSPGPAQRQATLDPEKKMTFSQEEHSSNIASLKYKTPAIKNTVAKNNRILPAATRHEVPIMTVPENSSATELPNREMQEKVSSQQAFPVNSTTLPVDSIGNNIAVDVKPLDAAPDPAPLSSTGTMANADTLAQAATTGIPPHKKLRPWKWIITMGVGMTEITRPEFFSQEKSSNNMNPGYAGPRALPQKVAAEQGSSAFSIGAGVQKQLSKHLSLMAGISYSRYTTTIQVGTSISSIVFVTADGNRPENLYSAGTNTYLNRYQNLEFPIALQWQPSLRLPLFLNTELRYTRLLSSRNLVFDPMGQLFYEDQNSSRRGNMQLGGSIDCRLWQKNKRSLLAGPYMRHTLGSIYMEEPKKFLLTAGVAAKLTF